MIAATRSVRLMAILTLIGSGFIGTGALKPVPASSSSGEVVVVTARGLGVLLKVVGLRVAVGDDWVVVNLTRPVRFN